MCETAGTDPGARARRVRLRNVAAIAGLLAIAAAPLTRADTPPAAPSAAAVARTDTAPATPPGDPKHGQVVYQVCASCHSIDEDDVGPRHRGVVGRVAGTVAGYPYSPALKAAGLTWDAQTLDRWLTNPQRLVPGSKMFFLLSNPQDRADVIAYLSQLK
ncbi:MAG TPA: cytochrome c family protein [Steroidobacteraceae bacterium]|nr:cytochrome c family protein [Steroidobacteraceae bacterium]